MRWPWQDRDKVKGPDDYPLDTYNELYMFWIGLMLTGILFFVVLGYIVG